jgi:hypothetical protein
MRPARGVVLVPHSRCALGVSVGAGGFYRSPSPACLRKRVHPLVTFTPLQSSTVPCPPSASRRQAPSLGSAFPLRDFGLWRSLRNGGSIPRHLSVLGVSHALDGLLRHLPCGFISPHCHVQGFPSGACFPPHSRLQLVAEVVPSRRLTEFRYPRLPVSATSLGPALRAFSPCGNPQPLLRCLAAASVRSPPGLPLLQVFTLNAVRTPSRSLPLVTFMATLSSHCHHGPSAFRRRAWLASLEAAYLLEVFDLPAMLSCSNLALIDSIILASASTENP